MINAIPELISNNKSEFITSLKASGFNQQQAKQFLPVAGERIMDQVQDGVGDFNSILEKINISTLAEKTGIDPSLVNSGLRTLIPSLLTRFSSGDVSKLISW